MPYEKLEVIILAKSYKICFQTTQNKSFTSHVEKYKLVSKLGSNCI